MAINNKDRVRKIRRELRVSNALKRGTALQPRVAVFKSLRHIHVQMIDDTKGATLVSVSSLQNQSELANLTKTQVAIVVGTKLAEKAKALGIARVVFDRSGEKYTGRVSAIADALRAGGIHL